MDAEIIQLTPSNAELLVMADRSPAPQEWYEEDDSLEPLWDPIASEVQLLILDYFERADEEWEIAEGSVE